MANASLQIGNGNWAIKEDNLLGYSKSGTRFLPIPITMTRATLGTRVNPSGLIENVELLGSELVTNGDFSNGETDWFFSTECEVVNNQARIYSSDGGFQYIRQSGILNTTKQYKLEFDVVSSNGADLGITGASNVSTSVLGKKTVYFNPTSTYLQINRSSGVTDVTIDNVTVEEVTIDGLARVDYTDGTASLLVEPQRTNLITYSEDFTDSSWIKNNATLESGFVSPDGTENAYKLVEDLTNSIHRIRISTLANGSAASKEFIYSFFVKKAEVKWFLLKSVINTQSVTVDVWFDLENGVIGTESNGVGSIENYGNDWYRCSINIVTDSSATSINVYGYLAEGDNSESYQGDGTSGLYIYGAQLEEGSYPTSYIKTTGSTVTRNQDEYTKTGISDKINSEEGVLFAEIKKDKGTQFSLISLDKSSDSDNYIYVGYLNNTTTLRAQIKINGSIVLDEDVNIGNTNVFSKVAVKYKSGDYAFFINGSKVGNTSTSTDSFSDGDLDRLELGYDLNSIFKFYGNVRQLQIYKTALSDSELATLTT